MKEEEDKILKELEECKAEHRKLDDLIKDIEVDEHPCYFTIQRHKKRKLWLKDRISYLQSLIYPDIIA